MQDYDVTLKLLLSESAERTLRLMGASEPVRRWLNVELPRVRNQRVDLLAELTSGKLLHIELQNRNIAEMPRRMLEYGVAIWQMTGSFPRQIVLYVGNERLRMPNRFQSGGMDYRYELVDIRDLDGEVLLASDCVSDNILALLARVQDKAAALRRILRRIVRLKEGKREVAIRKILILCGMRGLERLYEEEEKKMPIDLDIMDHKIIGPAIRKGMAKGIAKGMAKGMEQGLAKGIEQGVAKGMEQGVAKGMEQGVAKGMEQGVAKGMEQGVAKGMEQGVAKGMEQGVAKGMEQGVAKGMEQGLEQGYQRGLQEAAAEIVRRLAEKRFGSLPPWVDRRLKKASTKELEELAIKVLDARNLKELLS